MPATPLTGPGASGFVMFSAESPTAPGTWVTPTNTLFATAKTGSSVPVIIRHSYYAGQRAAETGLRQGKFSSKMQLQYPLFPNVGTLFQKHALGSATYMTALAATTTTALATTANGITPLVLTAAAAYTVGAWVYVGTGANLEPGRIVGWASGTKTLQVAGLKLNINAPAATAVVQPAQHKFRPLLSSDAYDNTLPTMSVEANKAGIFSWQRAGCYVGQFDITAGNQIAAVTLDLTPTVMPVRPATPTAFAPSAIELADKSHFFSINDGFVVVNSDAGATGGPVQQVMPVETWKLTINNTVVEKSLWNNQSHVSGFPTVLKINAEYSYINYANRVAEFEDFLATSLLTDMPFFAGAMNNYGSLSSPLWNCWGAYIPSLRIVNTPDTDAVADMLTVQVQGEAETPTGNNAIEVYIINSVVVSY